MMIGGGGGVCGCMTMPIRSSCARTSPAAVSVRWPVDLVPPALRNSWFYRLAERRFGKRAVALLTFGRQTRIDESLRQCQTRKVKRSSDMGMGM
jgi:hypothetical protein